MSEKRRFAFVYSFIHSFNSFNESIGASLVAQMVKNLPANAGDLGLIPGSGRSPGEGNGNQLQYSCLEIGAWQAPVHGVSRVRHD